MTTTFLVFITLLLGALVCVATLAAVKAPRSERPAFLFGLTLGLAIASLLGGLVHTLTMIHLTGALP